MIVEDECIVAEDLRMLLQRLGYTVNNISSSGERALETVKRQAPDLILMDIHLDGDLDGIETTNRIRSLYDIPIIFLTAYADETTLGRAKLSSRFGYIMKPFEEREIHLSIEVSLYKHAVERRLISAHVESMDDPSLLEYTQTGLNGSPSWNMYHFMDGGNQTELQILQYCRELREIIRHKDRLFGILSEDKGSPTNMLLHYCESMLKVAEAMKLELSFDERNPNLPSLESLEAFQQKDYTQQSKYISLSKENIQLSALVNEIHSWFGSAMQTNGIALQTPDSDILLHANPRLLRFVLRHVMMTAIDFTTTGGSIELQCRRQADVAELAIAFSIEKKPERAGELVQMLSGTDSPLVHGTTPLCNSTLARCKQIVQLQGQDFVISSIPGARLCIAFTLEISTEDK